MLPNAVEYWGTILFLSNSFSWTYSSFSGLILSSRMCLMCKGLISSNNNFLLSTELFLLTCSPINSAPLISPLEFLPKKLCKIRNFFRFNRELKRYWFGLQSIEIYLYLSCHGWLEEQWLILHQQTQVESKCRMLVTRRLFGYLSHLSKFVA